MWQRCDLGRSGYARTPGGDSRHLRSLGAILVLWLAWQVGSAEAADDLGETPRVSTVALADGTRTLVVDYPWHAHRRASIELRLVTDSDASSPRTIPLMFAKECFQGMLKVNVFHFRDHAHDMLKSRTFTKYNKEFTILGQKNSLGRRAVCVGWQIPRDDSTPDVAAAYCLLPEWSLNKHRLHLDLSPELFTPSGTLYVWFLREDRVLWQGKLVWPGYLPGEPLGSDESRLAGQGTSSPSVASQ